MMGVVMPNGNLNSNPGLCSQALTPWNEVEQFASVWLERYVKFYSDSDPTSFHKAVFEMEKGLLYEKYVQFCQTASSEQNLTKRPFVTKQIFSNIWLSLFPYVHLKRKCHIVGKCTSCYIVQDARDKTTDHRELEALKQIHALHRATFMGERNVYQETIIHACIFIKSVLSIIVDGMDNNNCLMPYLGSQVTFPKPLEQGITGALVHGPQGGMTLYRTFNNINKGPNLTIHILLTEILKFVKRNGCYPEEIFFQADGACDNANKFVLAFLEYIVAKRITQRAVFTRHQVGHTHNDVDGGFGVLADAFRGKIFPTLDKFVELIESARLNGFNVVDVMIIPDFENFFEPCIDKNIQRLHREMQTQLQWRFTAIDPLKNGGRLVDVTYRAYAKDEVIEIFKRPVDECKSSLGKASRGFEPVTTYISNFPLPGAENAINFLRFIPVLPQGAFFLSPAKFNDNCLSTFAETQRECNSFFARGSQEWNTWRAWFDNVVPKTLNPLDFLKQIQDKNLKFDYFTPFLRLFKGDSLPLKGLSGTSRHYNEIPIWSSTVKAYSTPSVASSNNRNPPPPRLIVSSDENELRRFDTAIIQTEQFFTNLTHQTQAYLELIIIELITPDGRSISKTGTKSAQISKLNDFFKSLLSSFVDALYLSDELSVTNKLIQPHTSMSLASSTVATVTVSATKICRLPKSSFQCLLPGMKLTHSLINFVYLLYKNSNLESLARRKDNYRANPNPDDPNPNPNANRQQTVYTHKKCLNFLSYVFLSALVDGTSSGVIDKDSVNDSKFIFIHVKDGADSLLLIADMAKGEISYYDPMLTTAVPNALLLDRVQRKYKDLLCELFQSYSSQLDFWKPTKVWHRVATPYITPPSNEFINDNDMYILSFVYFQLHYLSAPIAFNQSSVEYFRKKLAMWILIGRLPSQFY